MKRNVPFDNAGRLAARKAQMARVAKLQLLAADHEARALCLQNHAAEARRFADESKAELAEALKAMEGPE